MTSQKLSDLVPERKAWLRAAVTTIPLVGGALDHLLFDKADSIRLRNIEAALSAVAKQVESFGEERIDSKWFASDEALAAFRALADAASFEPDSKKVEDLGRIVAACGEKQHSADDKKLSVLEHLSRLSHTQILLLKVIGGTPAKKRTVAGGDINQTATAIWLSDIVAALKAGAKFWPGQLNVIEELEVLESLNVIRRVQLMGPAEMAYLLTGLGRRAAAFARTAGL